MVSVTQRIKQIKQPYGGYIPVKSLKRIELNDGQRLKPKENIAPQVVGTVVDYMTRFMLTHNKEKAFEISLLGAKRVDGYGLLFNINDQDGMSGNRERAKKLLDGINGNNDESVKNAIKLVKYDVALRSSLMRYMLADDFKEPTQDTLDNIKIMIHRSLYPFKKFSPLMAIGFTMPGGYTKTVDSGDGDYLTEKILWDFKVSRYEPNKNQTLQVLMYWLMLKHSDLAEDIASIDTLGLFNPRLNAAYTINVHNIDSDVIEKVKHDVIGYDD